MVRATALALAAIALRIPGAAAVSLDTHLGGDAEGDGPGKVGQIIAAHARKAHQEYDTLKGKDRYVHLSTKLLKKNHKLDLRVNWGHGCTMQKDNIDTDCAWELPTPKDLTAKVHVSGLNRDIDEGWTYTMKLKTDLLDPHGRVVEDVGRKFGGTCNFCSKTGEATPCWFDYSSHVGPDGHPDAESESVKLWELPCDVLTKGKSKRALTATIPFTIPKELTREFLTVGQGGVAKRTPPKMKMHGTFTITSPTGENFGVVGLEYTVCDTPRCGSEGMPKLDSWDQYPQLDTTPIEGGHFEMGDGGIPRFVPWRN